MVIEIVVPGVGESVSEGMLTRWLKQTGDVVAKDEPVAELETDKATVEIVAPASGRLETLVDMGAVVKVAAPVARLDTAQSAPASDGARERPSSEVASAPTPVPREEALGRHGPAVGRLVREGASLPSEGSGRGGRITKGDVLQSPRSTEKPPEPTPPSLPVRERRKPMSMMRRRIAERLLQAQRNAAILTTFNEVDMTAVQRLREQHKAAFEAKYGVKLGFLGFFVKSVVEALRAFPEVNARIEGTDIIYSDACDIGVAVSTEKGLVVPVLRNSQEMSLADVEKAVAQFAQKARDGRISVEDITGGTFSITNGGVFGSLLSTPILNPPQSGILGMHKVQMRPVCTANGTIEARPMMYIALSYDHRLIDGKDAVGFLVRVKECLEEPARLLLGV